jgi:large subunit ribosomal protein L29
MKASEVRELSNTELQDKLEFSRENLQKLKLNHAVSPLENPQQIKFARKTIARLSTEINKRSKENSKA